MTGRWRLVPIVFLSLTMHAAIAAILMTNRNTHVLVEDRSVEALPVVIVPEAAFVQPEHAKPAGADLPGSASDEPDTEIGAAAIRMPALELGDEPPYVERTEPLKTEPAPQPEPMATAIETDPPVITLPPLALNGAPPQIDVPDPAPDVAADVTEPPVPQPRQPELVPARPVRSSALPPEPKRNIVKVKPPRQEVDRKPEARREKPANVKEAPPKQARVDERQPDSQLKKAASSRSSVKGSDKARTAKAGGDSAPSAGKPAAASKAAMAGYGRSVNGHVARHKPRNAEGKGSVGIVLQIARSGALVGAKLASGSGNPALDRMALAAARGAAPYPAPPDGVAGARVAVMIRMSFR